MTLMCKSVIKSFRNIATNPTERPSSAITIHNTMEVQPNISGFYMGGKRLEFGRRGRGEIIEGQERSEGKADDLFTIEVATKVTAIEDAAFYECEAQNIVIPDTVTTIGAFAFCKCTFLVVIKLPPTIKSLGNGAFAECYALTAITLPPSVISVGDAIFGECISLTTVTLPPTLTALGDVAFAGCLSLTAITLPSTIRSLGWGAFSECTSLSTITIPGKVTVLRHKIFSQCSSLKSIYLPVDLTYIAYSAFDLCQKLDTITFSDTIFDTSNCTFEEVLNDLGFSKYNLRKILNGHDSDDPFSDNSEDIWYYETRKYARKRDEDGRLPLFTAVAKSLKWVDTKQIFAANMPALYEVDVVTELPLFLLAAVGPSSDIESVYHLLKEFPTAIML